MSSTRFIIVVYSSNRARMAPKYVTMPQMNLESLKNIFQKKFPGKLTKAIKYSLVCRTQTTEEFEITTDADVEKIKAEDVVTLKVEEKKSSSGGPIARWFWLEDGPMWYLLYCCYFKGFLTLTMKTTNLKKLIK